MLKNKSIIVANYLKAQFPPTIYYKIFTHRPVQVNTWFLLFQFQENIDFKICFIRIYVQMRLETTRGHSWKWSRPRWKTIERTSLQNKVNSFDLFWSFSKSFIKLLHCFMECKAFEGWYKRIENNGWRPVSNKHLIQMNLDYYFGVERDTKPVIFYHNKVHVLNIISSICLFLLI